MPDSIVTCEGIAKLLNLNLSKAAGLDENKSRVLKELATERVPILTLIFQIPLESDWKTAVYKKGSRYKPENYRPISVTCMCWNLL